MSSVFGQQFSQIPANKLWTNINNITSSIVDSNNNIVSWLQPYNGTATWTASNWTALGLLSTPGSAVLRDMGRTVYVPSPTIPTAVGSQSTILRSVQLVTQGTAGYYGTGNSAACIQGSDSDFFTGYIRLGAQTYGGGGSGATAVARIN